MAEFFEMPQATPTMEFGTLGEWKVAEGTKLSPQDVIAVVETDKAAMDVEVFDSVVLLKILAADGDEIPAGFPIAIIGQEGDDISALMAEFATMDPAGAAPAAEAAPVPKAAPAKAAPAKAAPAPKAAPKAELKGGWTGPGYAGKPLDDALMETWGTFHVEGPRVRISPLARKLAETKGMDVALIAGSGPNGRIVKADVEAHKAPSAGYGIGAPKADETVRNSKMRKVIAGRLKESYLDAPVFFLTAVLDCDSLVAFRKDLNGQLAEQGLKVSYNDLTVAAVAKALRDVPQVNASWGPDAITRFGSVDVGVAVALPDGLITPVIRQADKKTLVQLAAETKDLVGRARDRKLDPSEYSGAGFAVSNLGMMQIDQFTAIINPPGSGILAVGALQQEPVVKNGELAVGWRMKVTMTCDHRVIDGALGAQFLQSFRGYIENPMRIVVL
jgi:pyruvate dehydrogenase E2 component (dihydrolipoamide acetyltransferase)